MVEVEPSLLLCAVLDHQILIPDIHFHDRHIFMVRSINLVMFAQINLLFPFDLSLVHIIIHFPHSTRCLGTGHQVVALVFWEVMAVAGSCLILAPEVVFATQAQKELLLVAPGSLSLVALARELLLLLGPLQFTRPLLLQSPISRWLLLQVHPYPYYSMGFHPSDFPR